MEDTLINFETAKLAKEKGFNENVYDLFKTTFSEKSATIEQPLDKPRSNKYYRNESKNNIIYLRPTQSLLQKWLREVHKINVESNYLPNVEKYKCLFIPMTLKKPSEYSTPGTAFTSRFNYLGKENYNTYEEALEIGLQEALKLIK